MRAIYAAVLAGDSLRALTRDLNARGVESPQGTPWTAFKLRQLIDRRRNYGALVRYGVEQPESIIEPLVSRTDHNTARAIIAGRAQPGRKPDKHLLSGLAVCAVCERPMGAKRLKSRNSADREPYYMCGSRIERKQERDGRTHPTIRAHLLEAEVRRQVVAAMLYGRADLFPGVNDGALADAAVRLEDVRARMTRLEDAVEAGTLLRGRVAARMASLVREETAAFAAQAEAQARAATRTFADIRHGVIMPGERVSIERVVDVHRRLGEAYDGLDFDARRDLVRLLLSIRVAPGFGVKRAAVTHQVVTELNLGPNSLSMI